MKKVLAGILVTSTSLGQGQIIFDDESGVILDVGDLAETTIDYQYADDCLVFAGMGDIHIHGREDVSGKHTYKEDFLSASRAALSGGVTHLCDMPNNPVAPIDDASYRAKWQLVERARCPLFLYAGIGPGTEPLSFKVPYKAYMGPSVGELFFKNAAELEEAIKKYHHQWVSFHCEDPVLLEQCQSAATHLARRPVGAELLATDLALELIEKYSLNGKLCHYSAGDGLAKIKRAKERGVKVTCEVTPQHLYFSDSNIPSHKKTLFQMNPPIRQEEDRQQMLAGLRAGLIDFLATDHAPHSPTEKAQGMSGLTGLDTYGGFVTWLILEQKIDAKTIAAVCAENPGQFINEFKSTWSQLSTKYPLGAGLGFLRPGFAANFTILNLQKPITIAAENLHTKASWSPFEGVQFPGSVEDVFINGEQRRP